VHTLQDLQEVRRRLDRLAAAPATHTASGPLICGSVEPLPRPLPVMTGTLGPHNRRQAPAAQAAAPQRAGR